MKNQISTDKQLIIKIGDFVSVNFYNAKFTLCERAIVKYVPQKPGDNWILFDPITQELHCISEGCTITLLQEEGNGKLSISQFTHNYKEKLNSSMLKALIYFQEKTNLKFIEDITYHEFISQPNIGKKAWDRLVELRNEAKAK